jgi:hypothetical protein
MSSPSFAKLMKKNRQNVPYAAREPFAFVGQFLNLWDSQPPRATSSNGLRATVRVKKLPGSGSSDAWPKFSQHRSKIAEYSFSKIEASVKARRDTRNCPRSGPLTIQDIGRTLPFECSSGRSVPEHLFQQTSSLVKPIPECVDDLCPLL